MVVGSRSGKPPISTHGRSKPAHSYVRSRNGCMASYPSISRTPTKANANTVASQEGRAVLRGPPLPASGSTRVACGGGGRANEEKGRSRSEDPREPGATKQSPTDASPSTARASVPRHEPYVSVRIRSRGRCSPACTAPLHAPDLVPVEQSTIRERTVDTGLVPCVSYSTWGARSPSFTPYLRRRIRGGIGTPGWLRFDS